VQVINQISKELKERGLSVLKLSNETGIPAYRIYKWMPSKGKPKGSPKSEDVKILEEWLKKTAANTEEVPLIEEVPETGLLVKETKNPGQKEPGPWEQLAKAHEKTIKLLEERQQSETRLIQVEATLKIIVGILNGLRLPEQSHIPASGDQVEAVDVQSRVVNTNESSSHRAGHK
jgi:transcriptional regulator with XRE-family HTH domain